MSKEEVKKSEETKTEPTVSATSAPESTPVATEAAAPQAEAQPKLSAGLFQGFTLGATLKQGPTGNVMSNMKKPIMDYEKTYKQSMRNEQLSPEQFKAQQEAKAKKS